MYLSTSHKWLSTATRALLLVILVFTAACGNQPKPTSTPVSSPTTTPPPTPLPPVVVEVLPLPGSEVGTSTRWTLVFSEAMNRVSVEGALSTTPHVSGKFQWTDDQTVTFIPDSQLSAESAYTLNVAVTAQTAAGLTLEEPFVAFYQAASALRVTDRLPKPDAVEVSSDSAITATFNAPIVPLGESNANFLPAFSISPPVNGTGEWLNTSTYAFYPEPGLSGGMTYTVTVNPALTSTQGVTLSGGLTSWTFQTSVPKVIGLTPERDITWLDDVFEVTFNQPMDQAGVEAGWSLKTGSGAQITGKFLWNKKGDILTFTPDSLLPRSDVLTLNLSGDVPSIGGSHLDMPFSATFFTAAPLEITYPKPGQIESFEPFSGYGWIQVSFNAPIDPEDARNKIRITPQVGDLSVSSSENSVYISGLFDSSTIYTIRYPAGTLDIWGGGSQKELSAQFASTDLAPSLSIPMLYYGGRSVFLTPGTTQLPASAAALTSIAFERAPVSFTDFVWISQQYADSIRGYRPTGMQSWGQTLPAGGNTRQAVNLNLTVDGKAQEPGLYFYRLQYPNNPGKGEALTYFTTVVSRVQMSFKVSKTQAFVWAVNLDTNRPVSAAPVVFYNSTGSELGNCITDTDGICSLDNLNLGESYDWDYFYAMLGQPGDALFSLALSNWRDGISPYDFEVKGTDARQFYLYTERPIYRPGQTVNFRVITRNPSPTGYDLTKFESVGITVLSAYNEITQKQDELASMTIPLGEYQTGSGSFTLPEDAPVGTYIISIDQEQYSWHIFTVAEYRTPELELSAQLSAQDVKPGEDIQATLTAAYYFGAPVADLDVTWQLYTRNEFYAQPGGYQTGKVDDGWMQGYRMGMWYDMRGAYLISGNGKTSADGTLKVTIPIDELPEKFDPQDEQTLTWLVSAQEKAGAILTSEDTIQYHPETYTLGAKVGVWGAPAGSTLTFDVRAAGWDDKPIANLPVTARFEKVRWILKSFNRFTAESTYEESVSLTSTVNVRTDTSGKALLEFTPAEPGTWRLTLTSGNAVTELLSWVGGAGSAGWVSLPNQHLELTTDKTSYELGDTAKVFIPNPLDGSSLALVTVERETVIQYQVVRIEGSQSEVSLKLNAADAPNVYASVTLLGTEGTTPSFRMGIVDLPVALSEQVLDIQLSANPPEAGPGEDVTFTLKASDSSGNPVVGEFSLSLVDKAVLALADATEPGIIDAFYGHRILRVFTSLSLAGFAGRITNIPDLGGGGGGDGSDLLAPGTRTRFADTAYWTGKLLTDSNGVASVTVHLPDNLTTWVADARGITTDSLVGEAVLELTSSKELLIRPQLPRFVVAGDVLTVSAIVNNNSSENLSVSVDVNLNSAELVEGEQILKTVDIPAKGRVVVGWRVRIQPGSEFKTRFSATAGDLQDVVQPEALPILNYVSPLSYATSGVMNEAGSRLEVVALPRSYVPQGGELTLEVSPSLAAAVFAGLEALDEQSLGYQPEAVLSRLLPTLEAYQAVTTLGITPPSPKTSYETVILDAIGRLQRSQASDGGWGWGGGGSSNQHLTAYVLYGLSRAEKAGFAVTPTVLSNAVTFLRDRLVTPGMVSENDQLDEMAFQVFVLSEAGEVGLSTAALMDMRDRISPWAKACLAMAIHNLNADSENVATLLSDLESSAHRTASGASWSVDRENESLWISPNFVTAIVTYALARLDPASALVPDSVRFLSLQRESSGGWKSSYETAWALTALTEAMKGTGELTAVYDYSATLNQAPILAGKAEGGTAVNTSQVSIPIDKLRTDGANALEINRETGGGRLYYRAYLDLYRLASDAPAVSKGMTLTRRYTALGDACSAEDCPAITSSKVGEGGVTARLTLTIPRDMYNIVVEDVPPSGMEVFNPDLNINQGDIFQPENDVANPFGDGWGMWWFSQAEIHDDLVRWSAAYLPAGTYELIYQMTPYAAGEFQVIPARAWQYYFPEVQAATNGSIYTISE